MQPSRRLAATVISLVALLIGSTVAQAQSTSNMDILRDKLQADKKLLVASNLALTQSQADAFWPIYDEYQRELGDINRRLGSLIREYAAEYNAGTITDAKAKTMLNELISIDEAEVGLRKKYAERLDGVIPAIEVARYIQMENKIRAVIRFDLAAEVPLVQ